jgi:hypothetical protein
MSVSTAASYLAVAVVDVAIFTVAFRWYGIWDRWIFPPREDGGRITARNLIVACAAYAFGLMPVAAAAVGAAHGA